MGKVVLVVIDSLGLGAMEDVKDTRQADIGANTLLHVLESDENIKLPVLEKLGLMNALGSDFKTHKKSQCCTYGTCLLGYKGADSYLGHNEIMGISSNEFGNHEFSYFINEIRNKLLQDGYKLDIVVKKQVECLVVDDKILIGDNLQGDRGQLYTVIGAHGCNVDTLKDIGNIVREIVDIPRVSLCSCEVSMEELKQCIRVVDNKYIGIQPDICSLYDRKYNVQYLIKNTPQKHVSKGNVYSMLQILPEKNVKITLIGKVCDFVDTTNVCKYNAKDTRTIEEISLKNMSTSESKLIFINFQETDNAGHLCDVELYGRALEKIDNSIGKIINNMKKEDLLIVTADHGNDPCIGHSRHTRERVPILIYTMAKEKNNIINIGQKQDLSCINEFILDYFND